VKLTRNLKFNPVFAGLIPLVNVCFLVVIFFALSSRFVLQPGLAVSLPVSSYTLAPQPDAQIISITPTPVPTIYFRDEKVTLEELTKRLAQGRGRGRSLIVKADRGTRIDLLMDVMKAGLSQGFSIVLASSSERR
jgi:biopolymer transport protein ExbD